MALLTAFALVGVWRHERSERQLFLVAREQSAEAEALRGLGHLLQDASCTADDAGSLVDQDALREALDDGRVARASLDVVEPEPLPAGHWLYEHPKVRLSPHISWSAPGAIERLFATFDENLRRWRAGEPLLGAVDLARGY